MFINILKKFNFIDEGVSESDQPAHIANLPEDVHFVTSHVLMMPFPTPDRADDIANYLDEYFYGKYMIWNLSEHAYEAGAFGN
jgi:hypothetical protein